MRDRLRKLIADSKQLNAWNVEDKWGRIEDLADHLLANGVIVPPCKVGDKLFALSAGMTKVIVFIVTHLEVNKSGITMWGKTHYTKEPIAICSDHDIKEKQYIFLTKEEAEKALAERSGNE